MDREIVNKQGAADMPARKNGPQGMRMVPRFVYNPGKADRGLRAMGDILTGALRRGGQRKEEENRGVAPGSPYPLRR